jgi:hypothetical protein
MPGANASTPDGKQDDGVMLVGHTASKLNVTNAKLSIHKRIRLCRRRTICSHVMISGCWAKSSLPN